MKKNAFIICEYDPFHNGHAFHLRKTREAGAENIICLMSGNFMQRGEIAFCDKHTRARLAVDNGADLVLELPLKFVVSGARYFALGAADMIEALHIPGTLSFGASARLQDLETLAEICSEKETLAETQALSTITGASFARALQQVISRRDPALSLLLNDANNILALEYINALQKKRLETDLFAVERTHLHGETVPENSFASASYLRETMRNADSASACEKYMPPSAFATLADAWQKGVLPADRSKFSVAAMARLQELDAKDFSAVNGVNQGLENRILQCMKNCSDLYMLYDAVKTKRFTHARIRQIMISTVLGVKKEALERENPYIRVLGMNQNGRTLLKELKNTTPPIIMNLSEAPECEERTLDERSGRIFDLCRPVPQHKNPEYAVKPYVAG